eukprot:6185272-Pleurochrysis_carterae.AAC.3
MDSSKHQAPDALSMCWKRMRFNTADVSSNLDDSKCEYPKRSVGAMEASTAAFATCCVKLSSSNASASAPGSSRARTSGVPNTAPLSTWTTRFGSRESTTAHPFAAAAA